MYRILKVTVAKARRRRIPCAVDDCDQDVNLDDAWEIAMTYHDGDRHTQLAYAREHASTVRFYACSEAHAKQFAADYPVVAETA